MLLGAAVAAVAGCSTAAVPYDASEAGQQPSDNSKMPQASMLATQGAQPGGQTEPAKQNQAGQKQQNQKVLGDAKDIPVGGGMIYAAEKIVVTQPVKGEYRAFSAVCTHVGCILNKIGNGTIDCPCHGSEFAITNGSVVTGPAMAPLARKKIAIKDGKVILP